MSGLAEAAARGLFKLMAYKDEYEVARLYSDGSFARQVKESFEGDLRFDFHLSPPLLARRDPNSGEPQKMSFGPWLMKAFPLLASLRFLRGTFFDVFGRTEERRTERKLIEDYLDLLREIGEGLAPATHATAVELADIPQAIRGYRACKGTASRRGQGARGAIARALPGARSSAAAGGRIGPGFSS